MATETLSALAPAPASIGQTEGIVGKIVKSPIAETLFAYGREIMARPSATGRYLVPELEVQPDAVDLAYGFGTTTPRARKVEVRFDKAQGELKIYVVLPEAAVETALSEIQRGWHSVWNLDDLGEWLRAGIARSAEAAARMPDDATIQQLTARLTDLTSLNDDSLAQLFLGRGSRERVSREHYQRWRSGKKENASTANRRRMWFLIRLLEPLARAGIGTSDWVRNPTDVDDLTPFELLRLGRFDEVERLAARQMPAPEEREVVSYEGRPVLLEQGPASFTPRSEEPTSDLVFEDDDDWVETEDDSEAETDDG